MSSLTTRSRNEDRVLEIVSVPRHESDQDVAPEGKFAFVGVRAVGDDVALADRLSPGNNRLLVDAGARHSSA